MCHIHAPPPRRPAGVFVIGRAMSPVRSATSRLAIPLPLPLPHPLYLLSSEILFPLFLEVERVTREGDDR